MRHVELSVPPRRQDAVLELLHEEGIDYVVTDETSDQEYAVVVSFPLPKAAVEPILDRLGEVGIDDAQVVVLSAETVVSDQFDALEEEYATGSDVEEERISRQELLAEARSLTPAPTIYVTMTLISAIVATAGLLLDSPAVVVGSMVIAPLIGPALAAGVGTVCNEQELFRHGVKYQLGGIVVAVAGAAVFAWLLRTAFLVPPGTDIAGVGEISERIAPDLLSLPVALGAGIAGILSLSTGISVALVGVMIAAALIPPAAAAGIAIAWGDPWAALGSTVLVFVNVLSVNFAGLLTLWYTGYRPGAWFEVAAVEKEVFKQVAIVGLMVVVLSTFLIGATATSYEIAVLEQDAESEVEDILSDPAYEEVAALEVTVVVGDGVPYQEPERIVVVVGHPTGERYPGLAATLYERIEPLTDDDSLVVEVQFVGVDSHGEESEPAIRTPSATAERSADAESPRTPHSIA